MVGCCGIWMQPPTTNLSTPPPPAPYSTCPHRWGGRVWIRPECGDEERLNGTWRVRDVSSPIWGLPNPQPVRGCAVKGRKSLRAKASGKIAVRSEQRRRNGLSELPYTGRRPVAPPPPHEISRDIRGERVDVCPLPMPLQTSSSSGSSRGPTPAQRTPVRRLRCG